MRPMVDEAHEEGRAHWNEIASGWEQTLDYRSERTRHVTDWLVENVQPQQGDVILDLAGGPGDNGLAAATRVGPSGRIIETDFAPGMVEIARRRVEERGLNHVETRTLDAEQMDLDDNSVDGIICRWGFMLMLHPVTALKECRRVLKDGGRLALSVWGDPEQNPWITIIGTTVRELGYEVADDPFGPGGVFSMAKPFVIEQMLGDSGFDDITIEEMRVDWSHDSSQEAWDYMTKTAGPIARLVKELPADDLDTLRNTMHEKVEAFRTGTGIILPGVTLNAWAT
jgi:SAM-dependent methyltransferase